MPLWWWCFSQQKLHPEYLKRRKMWRKTKKIAIHNTAYSGRLVSLAFMFYTRLNIWWNNEINDRMWSVQLYEFCPWPHGATSCIWVEFQPQECFLKPRHQLDLYSKEGLVHKEDGMWRVIGLSQPFSGPKQSSVIYSVTGWSSQFPSCDSWGHIQYTGNWHRVLCSNRN